MMTPDHVSAKKTKKPSRQSAGHQVTMLLVTMLPVTMFPITMLPVTLGTSGLAQ
jgi:hypothetical protein